MEKKEIAEITIKLSELNGVRALETNCFGEMSDFAEIAQILKENKIENFRILNLFSTILEIIKEKN